MARVMDLMLGSAESASRPAFAEAKPLRLRAGRSTHNVHPTWRKLRKSLEADEGEGVFDARQGLDLLVDEVTDVGPVFQIALDEQVVLTGGRVNFRDLLDVLHQLVCNPIGVAEVAIELGSGPGRERVWQEGLIWGVAGLLN